MSVNHSDSYNDEQQQQQQDSSSSIRPNTLKNRIKQRAMAMESGDDDDVKDTNAKEVHISSVLAAASALASLGNQQRFTPPSTPVNSSTATSLVGGIEFDENATKSFPQKVREKLLLRPNYIHINTSLTIQSCLFVFLLAARDTSEPGMVGHNHMASQRQGIHHTPKTTVRGRSYAIVLQA